MKPFLLIALICTVGIHSFAQQNTVIWTEGQPLTWRDFTGPVIDTSHFDAESFAEVIYKYRFNSPKDFYFEVFANFNKNISWCRKEYESDDLLKHEQLHFDIAALYAQKLKVAFESYQYSEDYKNEITEIFNEKKTEYHLVQQLYDDETNHSLKKNNQKDWEKVISGQLSNWKFKLNLVKK
jgi:hypothetical protein